MMATVMQVSGAVHIRNSFDDKVRNNMLTTYRIEVCFRTNAEPCCF